MIINSELINPYVNLSQEEKLVKTKELYIENSMLGWDEKNLAAEKTTLELKRDYYERKWDSFSSEIKLKKVEMYCKTYKWGEGMGFRLLDRVTAAR